MVERALSRKSGDIASGFDTSLDQQCGFGFWTSLHHCFLVQWRLLCLTMSIKLSSTAPGTERVPEKSWHNYSGLVQVRGRVWRGRKIESRLKIALGLSENWSSNLGTLLKMKRTLLIIMISQDCSGTTRTYGHSICWSFSRYPHCGRTDSQERHRAGTEPGLPAPSCS